jgi:hypothetical protein
MGFDPSEQIAANNAKSDTWSDSKSEASFTKGDNRGVGVDGAGEEEFNIFQKEEFSVSII